MKSVSLLVLCAAAVSAAHLEPNRGQAGSGAKWVAVLNGRSVGITAGTLAMTDGASAAAFQLIGANDKAEALAGNSLVGVSHYLYGADRSRWIYGVPRFSSVQFQDVYRGIDLTYRLAGDELEFDFEIAAHSDVSNIRLRAPAGSRVNEAGALCFGGFQFRAPHAWQETNGRRSEVDAGFQLRGGVVSFRLGTYRSDLPLTIDPLVVFATYLGGSGADSAERLATGPDGAIYIAGNTMSSDFPAMLPSSDPSLLPGPILNPTIFLTRMKPDGSAVDWSVYVGGSARQVVLGLRLDAFGNLVLLGDTTSADFPVVSGAWKSAIDVSLRDLFVAKFDSSSGRMIASTYLGTGLSDNGSDRPAYLALDSAGGVYVCAGAYSNYLTATPGALQPKTQTVVLMRLNAGLTAPVYVTYWDRGTFTGIDVDAAGFMWITGGASLGFAPVNPPSGFAQTRPTGAAAAYVARLNPSGTTVAMATFLSGMQTSTVSSSIRVASDGPVYVSGNESGTDFPQVNSLKLNQSPPTLPQEASDTSPFLTRISADGQTILQSTIFYGPGYSAQSGSTANYSVTLTSDNRVCLTGLPFTNAQQLPGALGSAATAYSQTLACLSADNSSVAVRTLLPQVAGSYRDVAALPDGSLVFAGFATAGITTTPGVFQSAYAGSTSFYDYYGSSGLLSPGDGFIVRVSLNNPRPSVQSAVPDTFLLDSSVLGQCSVVLHGGGFVFGATVTVNGAAGVWTFNSQTDAAVTFSCSALKPGDNQMLVSNPAPGGGQAGVTLRAINAPPSFMSVSPSLVVTGAAETKVVIRARNLGSGSMLFWNGAVRAATLVSDGSQFGTSHFELLLEPPELAQPSVNLVWVSNPGPGGGVSATMTFAVEPTGVSPPFLSVPAPQVFGFPNFTLGPQLAFNGAGITAATRAFWDGAEIPVSSFTPNSVRVQPPAADLHALGTHALYISTGGLASQPVQVYVGEYVYPGATTFSAYDPGTAKLYLLELSDYTKPYDLLTLDVKTGQVIATTTGIVQRPHAIALSSNGQYLYIAEGTDSTAGIPLIFRYDTAARAVDLQWTPRFTFNSGVSVSSMASPEGQPNTLVVQTTDGIVTIYDGTNPRLLDSADAGIPTNGGLAPMLLAGSRRVYFGGQNCWEWLDFDFFGVLGGQAACGAAPPEVQQKGGVVYVSEGTRAAAVTFPGSVPVVALVFDVVTGHAWELSTNQLIDYDPASGLVATKTGITSESALYAVGDGSVLVVGASGVFHIR